MDLIISTCTVGPARLRMKLLSKRNMEEAIAELAAIDEYNNILHSKDHHDDKGEPIVTQGQMLFQSLMEPTHSIAGKSPHEYKWMAGCSNIPSPLEELNGAELCKLYEFLSNNGQYKLIPTLADGDCYYGSLRRGTTFPYEVADIHIKRLIIKAICNYHEFFHNLFKQSLANTYGVHRDTEEELQEKIAQNQIDAQDLADQRMPGPFSFVSFLKFMLQPSAYADSHLIMVMSMIWNIRITVVYATNCHELRFRHHKRLAQADLVMVVCNETEHFVSAGKGSHTNRKGF